MHKERERNKQVNRAAIKKEKDETEKIQRCHRPFCDCIVWSTLFMSLQIHAIFSCGLIETNLN